MAAWKCGKLSHPPTALACRGKTQVKKSALVKQLGRQLHSRKGQDSTLPASLWMRYKAVEQRTLSFADLGFPLRGQVSSPLRIFAVADGNTAAMNFMENSWSIPRIFCAGSA